MLIVAIIGLVVNITSILILQGSHKISLNVRSVFYHMIADAAASIGIVIVALIIMSSGIVISHSRSLQIQLEQRMVISLLMLLGLRYNIMHF